MFCQLVIRKGCKTKPKGYKNVYRHFKIKERLRFEIVLEMFCASFLHCFLFYIAFNIVSVRKRSSATI